MRFVAAFALAMLSGFCVARPAQAAGGRLENCDSIKDVDKKVDCLTTHVAYLEQALVQLNGQLASLTNDLGQKLSATSVFKLEYAGKPLCLAVSGDNAPPIVTGCDRPDSWKLVVGGQKLQKAGQGKPSKSDDSDKSSKPDKGGDASKPDKPKKTPKPKTSGDVPKQNN